MARTVAQVDARLTQEILTRADQVKKLDDRTDAIEAWIALQTPTVPPEPEPEPEPEYTIVKGSYRPLTGEKVSYTIFEGPGDAAYIGGNDGVKVTNSGVTLDHVISRGWGDSAFRFDNCKNLSLIDCEADNSAYAGFIGTGAVTGHAVRPIIRRIGTRGLQKDANAYGFVLSMWAGGPRSTDWLIEDAYCEDVPAWHAFDTHGGQRITFLRPTTKRVARPIFITANQDNRAEDPSDIRVEGGLFTDSKSLYPGNPMAQDGRSAITLYYASRVDIVDNTIGASYATTVNNIGMKSTYAESGTRRAETRP